MADKQSEQGLPPPPNITDDSSTDEESSESEPLRKVVVIGVDGSAQAEMAFRYYLDDIHKQGNLIVFVHAFELPLCQSFQEMYVSPDTWQATLKKESESTAAMEQRLKSIMEECKIENKFIARAGKPGDVIVRVAEEEGADLVVVGTRGQGRLRRTVLGSVSGYVNIHAPCPVLVCRPKRRSVCRSSLSLSMRSSVSSDATAPPEDEEDEYPDVFDDEPVDTRHWRFGANRRRTDSGRDSGCQEPDPSFFMDRRVELS